MPRPEWLSPVFEDGFFCAVGDMQAVDSTQEEQIFHPSLKVLDDESIESAGVDPLLLGILNQELAYSRVP